MFFVFLFYSCIPSTKNYPWNTKMLHGFLKMNKQMISKSNVYLGKVIVLSFGISLQMRCYIGHVCMYKNIFICKYTVLLCE